MDRVHPARSGTVGGSASSNRMEPTSGLLTNGPGRRGPELGRKQPRARLPAERRRRRSGLFRISLDGSEVRNDRHSAGRVRSRLVGGDGLMRRLFILCAFTGSCDRRLCPAPGPAQARFRRPARTSGHRCARGPISSLKSGADTVYFGRDSAVLGAPARATLAAQAQWLGSIRTSWCGSKAMAIPATRAIMRWRWARGVPRRCAIIWCLLGVPAAQLSVTSLARNAPALPRAVTVLVR